MIFIHLAHIAESLFIYFSLFVYFSIFIYLFYLVYFIYFKSIYKPLDS